MADDTIDNEDEFEESKMPLIDHLIDLRRRLIHSFIAIIVLFFFCYYFAENIFGFLVQPLTDILLGLGGDRQLIYTALYEAFFTYIKVAFLTALFIAFPFISMQLWMFVAPGLYKHEKMAFLPFLVATPILFFMGGALVYYLIFPMAFSFFISFEVAAGDGTLAIESMPRVGEYLSLVIRLIFAFGLCFELPVIMTLLARVGMITSKGMREKRKYAVVLAFVAAAILTPPDVISQIGLAVPTILLYEISILCVRMVEKKRGDLDEEEDDDDDDDDDDVGDGEDDQATGVEEDQPRPS